MENMYQMKNTSKKHHQNANVDLLPAKLALRWILMCSYTYASHNFDFYKYDNVIL